MINRETARANAKPSGETRPVTLAEFARMPEEDEYRIELVRGQVVREPRPLPIHGRVNARIIYYVEQYAEQHGTGAVYADSGFVVAEEPATVRGPDVAFVTRERMPPSGYAGSFWHLGPDLAVEVRSPSNRLRVLREKLAEYFAAGTRLGWIVDPKQCTVMVLRPNREPRELSGADVLDGEDVLPGFRLPLTDLFRL